MTYFQQNDVLLRVLNYLSIRTRKEKISSVFSSWAELLQGVTRGLVIGPLV